MSSWRNWNVLIGHFGQLFFLKLSFCIGWCENSRWYWKLFHRFSLIQGATRDLTISRTIGFLSIHDADSLVVLTREMYPLLRQSQDLSFSLPLFLSCQHFGPIACIFCETFAIPHFPKITDGQEEEHEEVRVRRVFLRNSDGPAYWCTRKLFMKFSGGQCKLSETPRSPHSKGFENTRGNQRKTFPSS